MHPGRSRIEDIGGLRGVECGDERRAGASEISSRTLTAPESGGRSMHPTAMNRRNFLRSGAALAATPALWAQESHAQGAVPNSSGTDAPKRKAPANACDCHMHVYDAERFPPLRPGSRLQTNARVTDYTLLQKRLGTSRTVVVTPAVYVTDNRVTLDAVAQLGPDARGVAVIHPTITDAELKTLADGGIRGIRFTQFDPNTATTTIDMIEPLSRRVNELGWHVQIHMRGDQIAAAEDLWRLSRHQGGGAELCRREQGGAGLRQGGAGARGVGQRLAASDRSCRPQAGRRRAVRPAGRVGTGSGNAPPHPGGEPGSALRLHPRDLTRQRRLLPTSPRLRGEVDLRAEQLRSEANRVRGHFHRLRLAVAPPHPDSCAALGIRPLPARGERWRKWHHLYVTPPPRRHRRADRARLPACRRDGAPRRRRGPSCRNRVRPAARRRGRPPAGGRRGSRRSAIRAAGSCGPIPRCGRAASAAGRSPRPDPGGTARGG